MAIDIVYVEGLKSSTGFAGRFVHAFTPYIEIDSDYVTDEGLLAHEMKHFKQFSDWGYLYYLLYLIPHCRVRFEIEAYKEQLKYIAEPLKTKFENRYIEMIQTRYRLKYDRAYIEKIWRK